MDSQFLELLKVINGAEDVDQAHLLARLAGYSVSTAGYVRNHRHEHIATMTTDYISDYTGWISYRRIPGVLRSLSCSSTETP